MAKPQRSFSFDTETTGLDPESGHRVVEIGCVEMLDYIRTGQSFHCYINPERDMPEEAEKIHGLSAEFLSDKPVFAEIAGPFKEFVGDAPLVAHNAGFDMKFINYELRKALHTPFPARQAVDTLQLARRKFPGQPASLDALCRRYDIDLSARTKHGALLDAELLADVYLELMGGRQSSFGLAGHNNGSVMDGDSGNTKAVSFPKRSFHLAEGEQDAHKAFLDHHLKEPIWTHYSA